MNDNFSVPIADLIDHCSWQFVLNSYSKQNEILMSNELQYDSIFLEAQVRNQPDFLWSADLKFNLVSAKSQSVTNCIIIRVMTTDNFFLNSFVSKTRRSQIASFITTLIYFCTFFGQSI